MQENAKFKNANVKYQQLIYFVRNVYKELMNKEKNWKAKISKILFDISYEQAIEQLKGSLKYSHDKCKKILEQQTQMKDKLKQQIKVIEQNALNQLDDLFKDLMNYEKNIDEFQKMLDKKDQQDDSIKTMQEFYQLTYESLKEFLEGLNKKQPHEFNQYAIKFGHLIEQFLHKQDANFIRFEEELQNNIHLIGKFNIDIFSEDESIRTLFGSLQYNSIIQIDEQNVIKNMFIPRKQTQVAISDVQQQAPQNQKISKQDNKIFTYRDISQVKNEKKNGEFKCEVNCGNQIVLIYDKLTYNENILDGDKQNCIVVIDANKGKFNGEIDPSNLELKKGTLTFQNSNQTIEYNGDFNYNGFFFKGTKSIGTEIFYKGYFDYKLKQIGQGCIWVNTSGNQKRLKYLGAFDNGKKDPSGISLRRQKTSNNTIFIKKDIFKLHDVNLIQKLDNFQEVDFKEIDTGKFNLIDEIQNSNNKYKINAETSEQQNCLIF